MIILSQNRAEINRLVELYRLFVLEGLEYSELECCIFNTAR